MPTYIFQHPQNGKIVELVQGIKETHEYVDSDGVKWNRVFTIPNASIPTKIDPHSQSDFIQKTQGTKGTLGDMWDWSKELSEKREKDLGKDPVKENHLKKYSKSRKGLKHQQDPSRTSKDRQYNKGNE